MNLRQTKKPGRPRVFHNLWDNVMIGAPDECWPWYGRSTHHHGHGRFYRDPEHKDIPAHREAFRLAHGLADSEMPEAVCHSCDNPPCCNPDHLWPGTRADNARDMHAKGRGGRWN